MPDNFNESPTTMLTPPVFNRVANYFSGQPFGNLLSFAMLAAFSWWFWWSQTTGEDQRAKRVQTAVDTVVSQSAETTKAMIQQNAESVKALAEQHSKTFESAMQHAEKSAARREADMQFWRDIVIEKERHKKAEADPPDPFEHRGSHFAAPQPMPGPPETK